MKPQPSFWLKLWWLFWHGNIQGYYAPSIMALFGFRSDPCIQDPRFSGAALEGLEERP